MSDGMIQACQHKALMRFIEKHGDEWKGLLLGLWKNGGGVEYLDLQELLSDQSLADDYFLVSLRRSHGARWLRGADKSDPLGHLAMLRAEQKRWRQYQEKPKRAWQKALERWKQGV